MQIKQRETATATAVSCAPILPVMVVLGNPKNPDCSQHGICRIYEAGNPHEACDCAHQSFALLSNPNPGFISLRFLRNYVGRHSLEKHFDTDHFLVEYFFDMSESVRSKLGLAEGSCQIIPGCYPILKTQDFLEIHFPIS